MITRSHFVTLIFFLLLFFSQLLKHGSTAVPLQPILLGVMEAAERRGLKQLSGEAAQALELLLSEVVAAGGVAESKTQTHPRSCIKADF